MVHVTVQLSSEIIKKGNHIRSQSAIKFYYISSGFCN